MTVTDAQVRLIMKERSNGKTQEQAAVKANVGIAKPCGNTNNWDNCPVS